VDRLDRWLFATWVEQLSEEATKDSELDVLFWASDNDGDGYISPAEFYRGLRGEVPEGRQQLLDKTFASLAGGPESTSLKWGSVNLPKDLLALVGDATSGSQALSRQEFIDYYLNCGMLLGERDFKVLLTLDWPHSGGQSADVSSMAKLAAGVGQSPYAVSKPPSGPTGARRPASAGPYRQFGISHRAAPQLAARPAAGMGSRRYF
jgi:hypothetical protein